MQCVFQHCLYTMFQNLPQPTLREEAVTAQSVSHLLKESISLGQDSKQRGTFHFCSKQEHCCIWIMIAADRIMLARWLAASPNYRPCHLRNVSSSAHECCWRILAHFLHNGKKEKTAPPLVHEFSRGQDLAKSTWFPTVFYLHCKAKISGILCLLKSPLRWEITWLNAKRKKKTVVLLLF